MTVLIDKAEFFYVGLGGFMRNATAMMDGRQLEEGREDLGFDTHVIGMVIEYAIAKQFDRFWSPKLHKLDTYEGDLTGIHAKSISQAHHSLIVRPHDPVEFNYVLGFCQPWERSEDKGLTIELLGWKAGKMAKVQKYFKEKDLAKGIHRPAYFVPQSDLSPMETLFDS